jgi:DNA-binding Xre family transcriptional regulator
MTGKTAKRGKAGKVGYLWHLRRLMADRDMYATTDLVPLLADRGITLSREQVYRLVTGTPERLSLVTLAALCDILGCEPGDLIEPVRAQPRKTGQPERPGGLRPKPVRAQVAPGAGAR